MGQKQGRPENSSAKSGEKQSKLSIPVEASNSLSSPNAGGSCTPDGRVHPIQRSGFPVTSTLTRNGLAHQDSNEINVKLKRLKAEADKLVTEIYVIHNNLNFGDDYPEIRKIYSEKNLRLTELEDQIEACKQTLNKTQDNNSRSIFPVRSTPTQSRVAHQDSRNDVKRKLRAEADKLVAEIFEIVKDGDFTDLDDAELQELYFAKSARLEEIEEQIQLCEIAMVQAQDDKLRPVTPRSRELGQVTTAKARERDPKLLMSIPPAYSCKVSMPTSKSPALGANKSFNAIPKRSALENDRLIRPFVLTPAEQRHLIVRKGIEAKENDPKPFALISTAYPGQHTSKRSVWENSKSSMGLPFKSPAPQINQLNKPAEPAVTKAREINPKPPMMSNPISENSASRTAKNSGSSLTTPALRFRSDAPVLITPTKLATTKTKETDPKPFRSIGVDVSVTTSKSSAFGAPKSANSILYNDRLNASELPNMSKFGELTAKKARGEYWDPFKSTSTVHLCDASATTSKRSALGASKTASSIPQKDQSSASELPISSTFEELTAKKAREAYSIPSKSTSTVLSDASATTFKSSTLEASKTASSVLRNDRVNASDFPVLSTSDEPIVKKAKESNPKPLISTPIRFPSRISTPITDSSLLRDDQSNRPDSTKLKQLTSSDEPKEADSKLPDLYPWEFTIPYTISKSTAPLDERLVNNHMVLIDEILLELYNTVSDVEFNPIDPRCDGILKAKQAQLEELRNQLRVYETVMARAKDKQLQKRESYRFSGRLPAFGKRSEIDDYIDRFDQLNRFLIIQGQTGSGKSTQLPQYIADHPRMCGKKVICTQPRKIAAIALADRVSVEYACGNRQAKVGFPVGYSVGGSRPKTVTGKTKIEFMTESRMLERLMNRQEVEFNDIGAIIVDEAHERSITCDILLGMLKKSDPLWNDVLIVVSSATIDLNSFYKFFDNRAKIVEIDGRMYPVERIYRPPSSTCGTGNLGENGEIIEAVIEIALEIHSSSGTNSGDILCFLPGADEIRRGVVWLEKNLPKEADNPELLKAVVYQLSGAQEAEEQRQVFEELDPKIYRKIILASPIAETSITINGVVYVVDSGVRKEKTYDPKRNISSLKVVNISQSSALQREGRAGRTQPGICYKLYSEEDFQTMSINTLPEIFRRPLPLAILYLRKMGIDPLDFDWVSAPDAEAIRSAEEELIILGAIEKASKRLTDLGELISQSQHEPKMVRMIFTGLQEGAGVAAIKLAALLSVSKSFFNYAGKNADAETRAKMDEQRKPIQHKDGDILAIFKLYTQYESLTGEDGNFRQRKKTRADWLKKNELNVKSFSTAEKTVADLKYIFSQSRFWRGAQDTIPNDEDILKLFCSGYFLHAACRVNIKSRGRNRLHYFALEPEVSGCLPFKASFVQTRNGKNDSTIPDWILFDQIMKYPDTGATFFPSTSRIDSNWILKESEEFYVKCLEKQQLLPTEVVEKEVSDTILKTIFGKRCANLQLLEEELNCSIDADMFSGSIRAFCSKISRPNIDRQLSVEIDRAKDAVQKETLELTWLTDTRLVIGPGYEVKCVLFSGEFSALYIRNFNRNFSRREFEQFVYSNVNRYNVSSLQFVPQERSNMGIIKLTKPSDAVSLLNQLKEIVNAPELGNDVIVAPRMGDGYNGTIPKAEQLKLKISWPVGFSVGHATIFLETLQDGNRVVDMLPSVLDKGFPFASAIGNLNDQPSKEPRVYREFRGKMRFLEDATYPIQPVFKVRLRGLLTEIDEFEITDCLKKKLSITPLRVTMKRNEVKEGQWLEMALNKEQNLMPFRNTFIGDQKDIVITDMIDKFGGRAGVLIYHPDTIAIEDAFCKLQQVYSEMTAYDQPYRVELERLFTFSVHVDLYQCLKPKFRKAVEEIKNWGVWTSVTGPGTEDHNQNKVQKKSKFVYIKFRHTDEKTIRNCRRKLESVLERDVLDTQSSPKIADLFTHTGRIMVEERIPASNNHYIHWDNHNFRIYIYGRDATVKNTVKGQLETIMALIAKWKQAGCFEVVIMLDRKALERYQKTNRNYIDSLCRGFNFTKGQYRLIGTNKLIISTGSTETLERFQNLLENRGLKMEPRAKSSVARDCGICFCEVDKEFMVTSICNHAFCMGCIRPMFASAAEGSGVQMPLRCPADKCETLLPVQDIMKAAPAQSIPRLNDAALNVYRQTVEGSKIEYCPKPGCNQIYIPNKSGSEGPTFYFCDNCLTDYCLECTASLGKDVPAHPGLLCKDVLITEDDKLYRIVKHIRDEILNLRCPRCTAAYYDFDGCAALTCTQCQGSFCALCLKECANDSEAHTHVVDCSYNTIRQVYVEEPVVQEANRRYRIDKLSEYFRNSSELSTIKIKILEALSKDLEDLNIRVTDIHWS